MEGMAGMLEAVLRRRGINLHAADRIGFRFAGWIAVVVIAACMTFAVGVVGMHLVRLAVHDPAPIAASHRKGVTSSAIRPIYPSRVEYQGSTTVNEAIKGGVISRLKRIEGQVGGLIRMVGEDRYCVDVLTQINAVRAALHKVEEQILRDHVSHCVAGAFASGDVVEQRQKVEELVATVGRMTR